MKTEKIQIQNNLKHEYTTFLIIHYNSPIRLNCGTVAHVCVQVAEGGGVINWSPVYNVFDANVINRRPVYNVLPPK